jgi:hypothetical protein
MTILDRLLENQNLHELFVINFGQLLDPLGNISSKQFILSSIFSSIEPLSGLFLEYPRKKEMVKIMNGKILST